MKQNNLKSFIRKFTPQKRSAVAEVISSLLLVAITVAGAVILTTFLDESFVAGGLSVASSTDTTLKTIKLRAYDTRDGVDLMGYANLNNEHTINPKLCRDSCLSDPDETPANGGTDFLVIQFENRSVNSVFLSDVYLDNVGHVWDPATSGLPLVTTGVPGSGDIPADGTFSILSNDINDLVQSENIEITSGQTVNLLVKLDTVNPDIELSKTIRVQLNIGANSLADFLIESGDTR